MEKNKTKTPDHVMKEIKEEEDSFFFFNLL